MIDASLRRTVVTVLTYGLLGVAFVLGVIWFLVPENNRWEPAVNTLTLVAGLTGIFVDRLSREAERRREVLAAVTDELAVNERLLGDERFSGAGRRRQIYPRLVVSAVDVALVSGVLARPRDSELVTLLHRWRDTVHELNRRLDLTEFRTFSESISDEELASYQRALQRENSFLAATRERLNQLTERLPARG
ncbi:hypothetical protein [Microlunatus sp. GCM10028923]|uniref:hypothetical protein n=1 Tax=Microlunatus sp. GCM10028923 TaxID=3273400 RepID=UPI003609816E